MEIIEIIVLAMIIIVVIALCGLIIVDMALDIYEKWLRLQRIEMFRK